MDKTHLKNRPEIDGLRAIAVLAVILFHAEVPYVHGGFVGVDVFYVISGYLITKIIITQLHNNNFSFKHFYVRRIKRLFPAAFFLILFTVFFGSLILSPGKYIDLAKSAFFSSAFLANAWFAKHSGYFDQAAEISPLVHLWSLAVEEQFYLFFPVLLYLIYKKWSFLGIRTFLVTLFSVSLILSFALSSDHPNSSFYLLHTRAWELCLGGLLVLFPVLNTQNKFITNALSAIGISLILLSIIFLSRGIPFPSYWALLPTIGTAILITSSHFTGSISNILLTHNYLVKIGKFSYSAYLWHWPVFVYYRIYILERNFTFIESLILIFLSLTLGYISWKFIEEKFRYKKYSAKRVFRVALLSSCLIMFISVSIFFSHGYSSRFPDDVMRYTDRRAMSKVECIERIHIFSNYHDKFCVVGKRWSTTKNKGVIWGDSHSLHWSQAFNALGKKLDIAFVIAPEKCPPYLHTQYVKEFYPKFPTFTEQCTTKHRLMVDWLNENKDIRFIVMTAAWSGHARMLYDNKHKNNYLNTSPLTNRRAEIGYKLSVRALRKTINSMDLRDRHTLLLSDIPRPNRSLNEAYFNASTKALREQINASYLFLDEERIRNWHKYSDNALKVISSENTNIDSIILTDKLCKEGKCITFINSELIYRDGNHIRLNLRPGTVDKLTMLSGLDDYFSSISIYEKELSAN
jgi:peptidoglycan/LPS O-acetylase OafA/YrhL